MSSFVSNPFNVALPTPVTQGTGDTKRWLVDERPRSAVGGPFHLCSPEEGAGADQITSKVNVTKVPTC